MKIPKIPIYKSTTEFIDDLRYFLTRVERSHTREDGQKHADQANALLATYIDQRNAAK